MSCNHCNAKFGFFTKELGCGNCGLSLCRNCLPQKWPKLGKVCRPCLAKLTQGPQSEPPLLPPEKFLKRLEKAPIATIDQKLAERLDKLKAKPQTKITDQEIAERLAKLKGQSPINPQPQPILIKESKSEQEQVDNLLEQLCNEPHFDDETTSLEQQSGTESESPELPWCVLCNEDAAVRCLDCGGDLYCGPCNVQGHKEWGEVGHRAEPYKQSEK